jgi:hypothetical protein
MSGAGLCKAQVARSDVVGGLVCWRLIACVAGTIISAAACALSNHTSRT